MRRFAWLRLLLPGLCAGLVPACLSPSPGPAPYLRGPGPVAASASPLGMSANQPMARPAAPEERPAVTRASEWERVTTVPVGGLSATGLRLRPREDPAYKDTPSPVLLASATERAPLKPIV